MSGTDRRRWDARHGAAGPDVPAPPDALRGREHLVPGTGQALDVGCGRGATAVWLAGRGLVVDAVDVSPVALAAGETLAASHGVGARVRWWAHDLDDGLPAACCGPYDVVACQRFRLPALYPVLAGLLAPGGLLAITVLSSVGGRSGEFRAGPGELAAAFAGLEVLLDKEGDGAASLVARSGGTGPASCQLPGSWQPTRSTS